MLEHENLRPFIPQGNCVPNFDNAPDARGDMAHIVFQLIDGGQASPPLLAAARQACLNCVQVAYCREQRVEIGNELWQRGVKLPIAGGEEVIAEESVRPEGTMTSTHFRFDLTELPTEPKKHLDFLRQGVRAQQFSIKSPAPKNMGILVQRYEELLTARDLETLQTFNAVLTNTEREKACRYILLAMCQQADFKNVSLKRVSSARGADNPRYHPDTHDFESRYPIFRQFVEEVIEIKELGFKNPGQMAMHHSTAYSRELQERFGQSFTPKSRFYELVRNNISDPYGAIKAFQAKLHSHRASDVTAPSWTATHRAWTNRPAANSEAENERRAALLRDHASRLGPAIVEKALTTREDPESRLATLEARIDHATSVYSDSSAIDSDIIKIYAAHEDYIKKLGDYADRVKALQDTYGKDPDVTPGQIRKFARVYSTDYMTRTDAYKKRLKLWRSWSEAVSPDQRVPDSYLKERAQQGNVASYDDIAKAHAIKLIKLRFNARNSRRASDNQVVMENWLYNRIENFYTAEGIQTAGENIFMLIEAGILTSSLAELSDLQDPTIQFDVDALCDPRNRKYLTFSAGLRGLSPQQRLMLARDHGLIPLLYGRSLTAEHIDIFLEESGTEKHDVTQQAIDLCANLSRQTRRTPIPFSDIRQDIVLLLQATMADTDSKRPAVETHDLISIVGAEDVQLAQAHFETELATLLSEAQSTWLTSRINACYPPSQRLQHLKDIENALHSQRLVLKGNTLATYQLLLDKAFYSDELNDVDRAVVAHAMNIDRLLYGKDLGLTLRYRLGTTDLIGHMLTNILPQTKVWKGLGAATSEAGMTLAAFRLSLGQADMARLWRLQDRVIAVGADVVAGIGTKTYPHTPSATWKGHHELVALAGKRSKDLRSILKEIHISDSERTICASRALGLADIFYSPSVSHAILARIND